MLKNNNRNIVKKIVLRTMHQNRIRNMFAVLAIILTTFMFTTVFSIGFSLGKNLNVMLLREQGTKATITLVCPTDEQIAQAKSCPHLYAAGLQIPAASAQSTENAETIIALDYYNPTEFEENFSPAISDVNGYYPIKETEIMLSMAALEALGIQNPTKQMQIVLVIDNAQKSFQLSGWFTDYSLSANGFQGFVSEAYTESLGLCAEQDGILSMSAKTGTQAKLLEELEQNVTLRDGQTIESSYDTQDESGSNMIVVIVVISFIGLIIVFSGYLLIYNVMYISVTKDIRFYGLLKTVGTSPRQLQKIVRMQAFRLSVIGIPIGILLGTLVSFLVVPYAMQMFGTSGVMPTEISFNPLIYVGTILFGIITVAVSCRKPSKIAGRVLPVEALKYNGQNTEKIKPKKGTDGGKLHKMAFRNVFREKKRAILVFASLFMGTMAFLATNALLGSLKLENYTNHYLPDDYTIYTNCGGDGVSEETEKSNIAAALKLAEDIKQIDGVTDVEVNHSFDGELVFDKDVFQPFLDNAKESYGMDDTEMQNMMETFQDSYCAPVISVSRRMMELYNQTARQKIDLDRFEQGEVCLVGYVYTAEQADQVKGKTITLKSSTGEDVSLEVGACPTRDDYNGINIGYYWLTVGAPECILVSDATMEKLTETPSVDNIIVECDPDAESFVTSQIKALTKVNPSVLQVDIKSELTAEFQSSMMTMNILTAGISVVLILIGIINFVNVMLTGVFTRRKELAVMESVGMTKKQVRKMLMYEGLYYGLITIALIMTVGTAIVYGVANLAQKIADYAVFYYPWALMIGIAAVILVICILIPAAVYQMISKDSITERLRMEE